MKAEIKIPVVGESINSAVIGAWQKKSGDYVHRDDILVLLETDKASVEVPAEESGQLEILKKEGEEASVGEVIGTLDTSVKAPQKSEPSEKKEKTEEVSEKKPSSEKSFQESSSVAQEKLPPKPSSSDLSDLSQFSPATRHILVEKNIHPQNVQGTGKDGRIQKSDLLNQAQSSFVSEKQIHFSDETYSEKMTTIRKRTAERLVASQKGTATLTTFNEVDMTRILALRKEYQEVFQKKYGIKLGFMGFFIKAVIQAFKKYPRVGAQIKGQEIIYHKHAHINIAVSSKRGLIVPVIKYADQMSIAELEKQVFLLAEKTRKGKILPDDLIGGIFTISNGGVFGSLLSTPILNPPQSGILGMHKMEKRPVVIDDQIVIRPMMYLALSYDHRIIDGKESVGFLKSVKEHIEEPARLLLEI